MSQEGTRLGEWITTAEAAKLLGVTARRVRQLAKIEDRLGFQMVTPRMMFVRRADVERYKAAQD